MVASLIPLGMSVLIDTGNFASVLGLDEEFLRQKLQAIRKQNFPILKLKFYQGQKISSQQLEAAVSEDLTSGPRTTEDPHTGQIQSCPAGEGYA